MTTKATHPALVGLPQGWFHHGSHLLALLEVHRPRVYVELGSWRGASAIAVARVIREWGGVVYCVDTWTGDVNGSWGTRPGHPGMLAECAGNIVAAGVAANVRFIAAPTTEAARCWSGSPIEALYIDADHSYESTLADLRAWWPHLRVGGFIAGDDYLNPMYPGVEKAWCEFEREAGQSFARFATPNTEPPGMELICGVKVQTDRNGDA